MNCNSFFNRKSSTSKLFKHTLNTQLIEFLDKIGYYILLTDKKKKIYKRLQKLHHNVTRNL